MIMCNIKIFVTHTPNKNNQLVENPLLVNVIAGAEFQKEKIPFNMVGDNTGDNISLKNKSYCELTTQYWAWKNVDADYYGFCHYRRFFMLSDGGVFSESLNERGQIVSRILNKVTIDRYGLNNELEMQKYITKYDCILPVKQDLRKLQTPRGKAETVYGHFAAHDRLFMHSSDLKILIKILNRLFPDYKQDAYEYLQNPYFWGFNCFILKKQYFNELCEFEFAILAELEKRLDVSLYNRQTSRVYGFMGEILSCIFFYHLQKTIPHLQIAENRLVYFEVTEKTPRIKPFKFAEVPIVFYLDVRLPFLLDITLMSFLEKCDRDTFYNVIIFHYGVQNVFLDEFKERFDKRGNIYVYFWDYSNVYRTLDEMDKKVEDVRLLLPWILSDFEKILLVSWNTLFTDKIDDLLKLDLKNSYIAGVKDVLAIGRAYDVNPRYERFLKKKVGIKNAYKLINSNVLVMNLKQIRNDFKAENVLVKKFEQILNYNERINLIFQSRMKFLPQKWNYYYSEDLEEKRIINQIPLRLSDEYNCTIDYAKLITYNMHDIWNLSGTKFWRSYWNKARESRFYELFLEHLAFIHCHVDFRESWIMAKINGWFLCVQDHGLLYTLGYMIKKIVDAIIKPV